MLTGCAVGGVPCQGVADALGALADRSDVIESILTGNTRPAAEIQLRTSGLDRYLDLAASAYGTDDRANLLKAAPVRRGSSRRPVRGRVDRAYLSVRAVGLSKGSMVPSGLV